MNVILVVDDDPADLQIISSAFASIRRNLTLVTAESVDAAEVQLQRLQGPARPDLVVTDINMPRRDGTELISDLRERYDPPPVIIALSTSSRQRDIDDAYTAGANAFHTKPMSYTETVALCSSLLDYWIDAASLPVAAAITAEQLAGPSPPTAAAAGLSDQL